MMQLDASPRGRSARDLVAEPIAIVGMACRFPGADSPSEFWRRLAAGTDLVSEGEPGSGGRPRGPAVRGHQGAPSGMPIRCLPRRRGAVRRSVLPHLAGRSADARSAAAPDAGDELARPGRRRDRPGTPGRQPHRRVRRDQQQRVPQPDHGGQRYLRAGREPVHGYRHLLQHGHRPGGIRAGTGGAGNRGGHRLLVVAGGAAPGGVRPAAR